MSDDDPMVGLRRTIAAALIVASAVSDPTMDADAIVAMATASVLEAAAEVL